MFHGVSAVHTVSKAVLSQGKVITRKSVTRQPNGRKRVLSCPVLLMPISANQLFLVGTDVSSTVGAVTAEVCVAETG